MSTPPRAIILVDGTCVFCNRLVERILRWDRRGRYGFAHLQGAWARRRLAAHGLVPDIDAIYLVADADTARERVLIDGAAGRVIWPSLLWLAWPMRLVPLALLNVFYRWFARRRYRLFGQADACIVPSPEHRGRFLDEVFTTTAESG